MKKSKKLLSVLLALAMIFTSVSVALVASAKDEAKKVDLPKDYTEEKIKEMVPALDTIVGDLLKGAVGETLWTNGNLNAVLSQVLPFVYGGAIKVTASPSDVVMYMPDGEFKAYVTANPEATWDTIDYNSINWGFKDGDMQAFADAISSTFRNLTMLAGTILIDDPKGEVNVDFSNILGCKSIYKGLVYPVLTALGLEGVMTSEEYTKAYNDGMGLGTTDGIFGAADGLVSNILMPVFKLVDSLMKNPIIVISEKLPVIAEALVSGKLDTVLGLVAPGTVGAELDLAGMVNGLLKDSGINIELPKIDLNSLVGLSKEATFVTVMNYLYSIISSESTLNAISELLKGIEGMDAGTLATINGVLGQLKGMQQYEFYDLICTLTGVEAPEHPVVEGPDGNGGNGNGNVDIPQTGDAVLSAFAVMTIAAAAAFVATKKKKA